MPLGLGFIIIDMTIDSMYACMYVLCTFVGQTNALIAIILVSTYLSLALLIYIFIPGTWDEYP